MPTTVASTTENLNKLAAFRQAVYLDRGPSRDALFELADAVLLMPQHAQSLAELSESPVFRRRWPSVYEALQDSRVCPAPCCGTTSLTSSRPGTGAWC